MQVRLPTTKIRASKWPFANSVLSSWFKISYNFALKSVGHIGTIAGASAFGGPIGAGAGTVYVAATITSDILTYNTSLQKKQIRFDYTNAKYQQNVANGSRWPGGSLWLLLKYIIEKLEHFMMN